MVGLFNTVGHETEVQTKSAAANLFEALASINVMLAKVERGDVPMASEERDSVVAKLTKVASTFEGIQGNDKPLFPVQSAIPAAELSDLRDQLQRHGISSSLRNRDLFGVAAREIHAVAYVVQHASFTGRHSDWYAIRDVVEQVNRLTSIGITFSRLASIQGGDPQLLN